MLKYKILMLAQEEAEAKEKAAAEKAAADEE